MTRNSQSSSLQEILQVPMQVTRALLFVQQFKFDNQTGTSLRVTDGFPLSDSI
ncbi:hypothetical protein DPMN_115754 [Dreissena polymorpha]|uniref:Uncharacterized protein n=1 Tax=Dreissena polymorpha TaxID=45954 RepID=A0A9D4KLS3_DREPO|nr:hypothetical protein DPMN_115754 [Dreissena polymorpha]